MPDKELIEGVDYLDDLIHGGSIRAASAALHTLGAMMTEPQGCKRAAVFGRVLGLLLTGIAHYDPTIHQTALTVLCRSIFGNPAISQEVRRDCLVRTGKKLLCLLNEPARDSLTFYNHAAMLNHLYRLIVSCEVGGTELTFPEPRPVAFFPGTFDPFSAGHKEIVRAIQCNEKRVSNVQAMAGMAPDGDTPFIRVSWNVASTGRYDELVLWFPFG